jgi:hypothetical protein
LGLKKVLDEITWKHALLNRTGSRLARRSVARTRIITIFFICGQISEWSSTLWRRKKVHRHPDGK